MNAYNLTNIGTGIFFRCGDRRAIAWRPSPSSIPELTMRRCALGKDTLLLFPIEAKQSTCRGSPA